MPGRPKLLLVDDNAGNLMALQAVLGESDYELVSARSGAQALELLKQHEIALVLLDIQMPGMDGFETARRIKQDAKNAHIPIIFITAIYSQDPYVKKGYEVGAVDFFTKPYDPELLKLKVRVYLSLWQKSHLLQERERQLRESEELLRAGKKLAGVLEKLPVGVIIADAEGRIHQVNEQVGQIWGAAELATDAYGLYLGWWDGDGKLIKSKQGPLHKAAHDGVATDELLPITCIDGTEKTLLISASPLRALDGRVVGAVVVMRDVTEQKQIEADLLGRIQKLISLGLEFEPTAKL